MAYFENELLMNKVIEFLQNNNKFDINIMNIYVKKHILKKISVAI